mmetsp:Transcript_57718/g.94790  ORF Transcript_57718/g.94790 Transcript_57718/m.94790 type:complete len:100 (-) Transcript_57718:857-1156(-)
MAWHGIAWQGSAYSRAMPTVLCGRAGHARRMGSGKPGFSATSTTDNGGGVAPPFQGRQSPHNPFPLGSKTLVTPAKMVAVDRLLFVCGPPFTLVTQHCR